MATEFHLSRDEPSQTVVLPREGLETVIQLSRGERSGQNVCVPAVFGVPTADRSIVAERCFISSVLLAAAPLMGPAGAGPNPRNMAQPG